MVQSTNESANGNIGCVFCGLGNCPADSAGILYGDSTIVTGLVHIDKGEKAADIGAAGASVCNRTIPGTAAEKNG